MVATSLGRGSFGQIHGFLRTCRWSRLAALPSLCGTFLLIELPSLNVLMQSGNLSAAE